MTTTYRGKVSGKLVRSEGDREPLLCCWLDCEKLGTELHKAREYLGYDPDTGGPIYTWYVFCSERCKMYWVHSSKDFKNLPAGYRLAVI